MHALLHVVLLAQNELQKVSQTATLRFFLMRISRLYSNFHRHSGAQSCMMTWLVVVVVMVLALVVVVVELGAKRWARSVLNTVAAHRPARPCSVHSSQLQRVGTATSLNATSLHSATQQSSQLLYATQLLCILQSKGARNFRATDLVFIPTNSHAALGLIKNCQWKAKRI